MTKSNLEKIYDFIFKYFIKEIEAAKRIVKVDNVLLEEYDNADVERIECSGNIVDSYIFENGYFTKSNTKNMNQETVKNIPLKKPVLQFHININKLYFITEYYFDSKYARGVLFSIIVDKNEEIDIRDKDAWVS